MREKWVDTNRRLSCASGALGLAKLRRVSDDKLAAASILALLCVLSWAWHTSAEPSTRNSRTKASSGCRFLGAGRALHLLTARASELRVRRASPAAGLQV